MRKTIIIALLAATVAGTAATFRAIWDASPEPTVTSYRIYSSTNDYNASNIVWKLERTVTAVSGTNIAWVSNIAAPPIRSFGVSAANAAGSESAKATAPILFAPRNLTVQEMP